MKVEEFLERIKDEELRKIAKLYLEDEEAEEILAIEDYLHFALVKIKSRREDEEMLSDKYYILFPRKILKYFPDEVKKNES